MNDALRMAVESFLRVDAENDGGTIARIDQAGAFAIERLEHYGLDITDPATSRVIVAFTSMIQSVYAAGSIGCPCNTHVLRGSSRVTAFVIGASHVAAQHLRSEL